MTTTHRIEAAATHLLAAALALLCGAAAAQPAANSGLPQLTSPIAASPAPEVKAAKPPAAKEGDGHFRQITWDELVPKDWDPMKDFRAMNFGGLSDADPKASAMLKRMRETWDNAPGNNAIDGQPVRLPGYLVPLEENKSGMTEFLLVPYFGACIHTPPPPSNQIVHVKPQQPARFRGMATVWISGTIKLLRSDTAMGASSYRMEAALVEPYVEKPR
jgi:hypothetical protein